MGRRFFLHEKDTFPPLDKRNTRDKAKGLRVASERYIGGAGRHSLLPERRSLRPVGAHLLHPLVHQKSTASHGEINRLTSKRYSIVKSLLSLLYNSIT